MANERKIEYYSVPAPHGVTIDRNGNVFFPPFYTEEDKLRFMEEFNAMIARINNTTE